MNRGVVKVRMLNNSTEFAGQGVLAEFTRLNIRYMRSRTGAGWLCSAAHSDDVMAALEARGYLLQVTL